MIKPKNKKNPSLTKGDEKELIHLLNKASKGGKLFLPESVFYALINNWYYCTIELAVICQSEILLTRRPKDDSFYPGQYHMPGTVVRPHEFMDEALQRLISSELGAAKIPKPIYLRQFEFPDDIRGHTICHMYLCKIREQQKKEILNKTIDGNFYLLDKLPNYMVAIHRSMIGWLLSATKIRHEK